MKPLIVSREAEADAAAAYDWYESRSVGLGDRFLLAVRKAIGQVAASPSAFPIAEHASRRAQVLRFPYALYFRETADAIVIVALFHGGRGPTTRRARLLGE